MIESPPLLSLIFFSIPFFCKLDVTLLCREFLTTFSFFAGLGVCCVLSTGK